MYVDDDNADDALLVILHVARSLDCTCTDQVPDIELPVPGRNISCISDTIVRESTEMLTAKLPNSNALDVGTPYEETLQE